MDNPNQFFVDGKAVTVKSRITVKEAPQLSALLQKVGGMESTDVIRLCKASIESWDFDGAPGAQGSYDELDVITELIPLANGVATILAARFERVPGNASAPASSLR